MSRLCTTKEQTMRLLELGLNPTTADIATSWGKAWSFAALFFLLPCTIQMHGETYYVTLRKYEDKEDGLEHYEMVYENQRGAVPLGFIVDNFSGVSSAYDMIKRLLKNDGTRILLEREGVALGAERVEEAKG